MAKFFNRVAVKTAQLNRNSKFDLSRICTATQDFYKPQVVFFDRLIPGQSIDINMGAFSRMSPLSQPFYGACRIINRAFAIPARVIMEGFNEMVTDSPYVFSGDTEPTFIQSVPKLDLYYLRNIFLNSKYSIACDFDDPSSAEYQYTYLTLNSSINDDDGADFVQFNNGVNTYYQFTALGRLINDILRGVGYKINFYGDSSWTINTNHAYNPIVSALPILAFLKVYYDYYRNPAYDTNLFDLDSYFKGKKEQLNVSNLVDMLIRCSNINLSSDYFTSVWDNPSSPNVGTSSNISIEDYTNEGTTYNNKPANKVTSVSNVSAGTPLLGTSNLSNALGSIAQNALEYLHRVTDYVRRHQLVGSRVLDRYMADYGIQLDSAKLSRSIYLGKFDVDLNISDVTQTANDTVNGTSVEGLGNYAGKGVGMAQNGHFSYTADEFTYIIITSYIEPRLSYVDGRPKVIHEVDRLDFFNGEFDSLGVEVVRQDELTTGFNLTKPSQDYKSDGAFGWLPRFSYLKACNDNMIGNFCYPSSNKSLKGWNLYRQYDGDFVNSHRLELYHNLYFTYGAKNLYHDMFYDTTARYDHFYTLFKFDVTSYAPMKPMYDTFDFEGEGKLLTMQVNGSTITD